MTELSLYGRSHRAVGLVKKEFLGEQTVVAIETDCHTFIAEGLASHNCNIANFWRAVSADPEQVAHFADWPVSEVDLHARHRWLVAQTDFVDKMKHDPHLYDPKIAGWWVWGISQWIGSGWCVHPEWTGRSGVTRANRGVHGQGWNTVNWAKRPALKKGGTGVHRVHRAALKAPADSELLKRARNCVAFAKEFGNPSSSIPLIELLITEIERLSLAALTQGGKP